MRDGEIISDERNPKQQSPSTRRRNGEPSAPAPHMLARHRDPRRHAVWAFGLMILAAAVQALGRNKMRSALTMLGVFIGVAALIAMVAVGQGANEAVRKQIESLGTNLLVVRAGRDARRAACAAAPAAPRRSRQRCPGDPARSIRPSARSATSSASPARSQYGNQNWTTQHPGRQRQLPADHQLADRRGPRHFTRRRGVGGAGRRDRPDRLQQLFGASREPGRRAHPGQGRAAAGRSACWRPRDRRVRPGPGRPRHGPVHHGRAQGARRRGAERRQQTPVQLDLSSRRPTPTACSRA